MKKQKNILHNKCQVDFLNNRYLNSREQKRMLHNKKKIKKKKTLFKTQTRTKKN